MAQEEDEAPEVDVICPDYRRSSGSREGEGQVVTHGKYNCVGASVCTRDGCRHCCWCGVEMNPAWDAMTRALFYVCKAMGPRDPEQSAAWWSWYDSAASVCA